MNFWTSVKPLQVGADRLEQPGKTAFSTIETSSLQKTCNRKLVVNFLHFPSITHRSKSDRQRRSYDCWNAGYTWKNLEYRFWFGLMTISQNSTDGVWYRIRKNTQYENDREFWDLFKKHKYTPILPTVQELWSLQVGVVTRNFWFLDRSAVCINLNFNPISKGNLEEHQI
jgi:hypothetical protein